MSNFEGSAIRVSELPRGARETMVQILVPVYNEGENVRILYEQLLHEGIVFDSLTFVYDFDEDTSLPFIEQISSHDSRVHADKNQYGRGVVNALRWGFHHVKAGPVIVLMGDNCDRLSDIPRMIDEWNGGATLVCPSRYMTGGVKKGGGALKSFLSRFACLSLKLLGFPTADATNNFRLYDGKWLRKQIVESIGGFEVGIELCYKAYRDNKKIVEFPTEWQDRTIGESKFDMRKWVPQYLKWYFRIVSGLFRRK